MKFLSLILILVSSVSFADEPVTVGQLALAGKGFRNKTTSESIALACLNEACSELQFVYFDGSKTVRYIGDRLIAPIAPTAELREEALALLTREYFYTHQTESSAAKIDNSILKKGYLILGGAVALALAAPTLGTSVAIGGSAVWTAGTMYLWSSSNAMDSVVSGTGSRATLTDKDGWNWSSKPKRVKADVFRSLRSRIVSGKPLRYFANQVYGSFDRDLKFQDQIHRKRTRLVEQGVEWVYQPWESR